jgi:hypothetical protein
MSLAVRSDAPVALRTINQINNRRTIMKIVKDVLGGGFAVFMLLLGIGLMFQGWAQVFLMSKDLWIALIALIA